VSNAPTCPCCGAPVDPLAVLIDEANLTIAHRGDVAKLTPDQFRLFQLLLDTYPRPVERDRAFDLLYGARLDCDQPEPKILDIQVCKMRPRLEPLGLVVTTAWGIGWTLTLALPEAAAALREEGVRRRLKQVRYDAAHDEKIKALRARGYGLASIARMLGIGYGATERAMTRLGLLGERQGTAA